MEKNYLDKLFFSDDLLELKEYLDQKLISINAVNEFGENALWFSLNNIKKIKFLIKEGIDLHHLTTNKQNILFGMSIENYLLANMEYDHNIKRMVVETTDNISRKYNELLLRKYIKNKIALKTQTKTMNNEKIDTLMVFQFNSFNYPDLETRKKLLKIFKSNKLNKNQIDIYNKSYKNYLNNSDEILFYNQILDKNSS